MHFCFKGGAGWPYWKFQGSSVCSRMAQLRRLPVSLLGRYTISSPGEMLSLQPQEHFWAHLATKAVGASTSQYPFFSFDSIRSSKNLMALSGLLWSRCDARGLAAPDCTRRTEPYCTVVCCPSREICQNLGPLVPCISKRRGIGAALGGGSCAEWQRSVLGAGSSPFAIFQSVGQCSTEVEEGGRLLGSGSGGVHSSSGSGRRLGGPCWRSSSKRLQREVRGAVRAGYRMCSAGMRWEVFAGSSW